MKSGILSLSLLLWALQGHSQTEFGLDLHTGPGLNPGNEIYGGTPTEAMIVVSQLGARAELGFMRQKRFEPETGLYVKYIHTNGQIGSSYFTYQTLRLMVPVGLKYNITDRWSSSAGCYIQNNRDLLDLYTGLAFNFRFDAYAQLTYQTSDFFAFSLRYQRALTNPGGAAFMQDPSQTIMGGITCYLNPHLAE